MRLKSFILSFAILLCVPAYAQTIGVASFVLRETDLTANLKETTVWDQNGDKCALIKILTTQKGFTFDVGILGVTKTEEHPAQIWMYVPHGIRKISIYHPTLGSLVDWRIPVVIESAMTYQMRLTTAGQTAENNSVPIKQEHNEQEQEKIPFQLVEKQPSFMGGGPNEFAKWVNARLVYPKYAKDNGIQGRVTLQFTVEADGSVTNVIVLRGVDSSLDAEAVRVVSSSPKWTPGATRGQPVKVTYTFPVIFQNR